MCVCVCVLGREGEEGGNYGGNYGEKRRQEKGHFQYHSPVVPPPGGVSAEMTPGKRRDRKSTPNL